MKVRDVHFVGRQIQLPNRDKTDVQHLHSWGDSNEPGSVVAKTKGWSLTADYKRQILICEHPGMECYMAVPLSWCHLIFDGPVRFEDPNQHQNRRR